VLVFHFFNSFLQKLVYGHIFPSFSILFPQRTQNKYRELTLLISLNIFPFVFSSTIDALNDALALHVLGSELKPTYEFPFLDSIYFIRPPFTEEE
jgi:hypothetical protein